MKVLAYPHPALKYTCKPVQKINKELKDIAAEMLELMYRDEGVGLAANQVGLPLQMFVMNASGDKEKKEEEFVFINPVILKKKGKKTDNEGCLSFPGIRSDVVRSDFIEVEGIDLNGEVQHYEWKGFPARVVQHETDHLKGIGFISHFSDMVMFSLGDKLKELIINFNGDKSMGFILPDEDIYRQIREIEERFC